MKINVKKRGLSPVIATVLLILLVVVVVSMLSLWARTFISDRTEGSEKPISELCSSVYFTVDVINGIPNHTLEIINRGNVDISAFEIKMYSGGRSEITRLDASVSMGSSVTKDVFLRTMQNGEIPERVEIFAILDSDVSGKTLTCYDDPEYLVY